ncbi:MULTISPECIES: Glu-tRNA(Gln) amidotransferase subunit GatD [Metallosphaera]|uniref:Glutamyl-tRNA(Gln) amidotransferase subunit D n=3 Tax=Metallosphaera TaxID=41980 RepID=GATD_METS5|nr:MULTISPECIES: Glu-tRNA(Gln) amidotransferase subunit GatD [Metallosphaera]A4YHH3.1 RecName: Full=Glutamyl-tRNA(Gln) amidotransferase subunit D; Short=Glu-ADT subunit D [Metallosphaera sedula DSM 5348]ABP95875.1 glutamyl-tRNA(Gln) amidotransferase subunit D [Metallosphaera sedula DSM 5348]AIM27859.1 glutamyl-tRNA(Gln) amidotransferase subunit D [Metallosphaera sedula]AKV74702.1 glutamyl-tRNA amidotransferase [Metallosphaera sedula]AKV76940.1 glutamyl-tRNA amidotransferase [Metallosphaera sed
MLEGYRGKALELLSSLGAEIGDVLQVYNDKVSVKGILMPSYSRDDSVIVLKLDNGYNAGFSVNKVKVSLLEKGNRPQERSEHRELLPGKVKIISTGGTIVSKVEYETGAVRPALSTEEIIRFVPEIQEITSISAEILFSILSENMKPEFWVKIAEAVKRAFDEGSEGVVVAHGTDTMSYTAAALAFSIQRLPGPVVLVGSQRSSDRPSSDSGINLVSSVLLAKEAPFGEVVVNMHGESSDTYTLAHRGVKVRKMHTSRRDAFQSINDHPLAKVLWKERTVKVLRNDYLRRSDGVELNPKFENRVFLLKFYPGLRPDIVDILLSSGYRGIIVEGTGLGHTSSDFQEAFKRAVKEGLFVGMTSQCLFGRVNMNVYQTGRLLQQSGVVPLGDMLPEVALVKLMWALGQTSDLEEVKRIMLTNLVGEYNPRHSLDHFPRWKHE